MEEGQGNVSKLSSPGFGGNFLTGMTLFFPFCGEISRDYTIELMSNNYLKCVLLLWAWPHQSID